MSRIFSVVNITSKHKRSRKKKSALLEKKQKTKPEEKETDKCIFCEKLNDGRFYTKIRVSVLLSSGATIQHEE